MKPERRTAPPRGRVLVFAPHADDEVIGCGGTLALHREQGDPVTVVVAFDGALGGDPARRRREAFAGGAHLGVADYRFLDYPEGHEPGDGELEAPARALAALIERESPQIVYAPWSGDGHVDHRVLSRAVRLALAQARFEGQAWGYEVWTALEAARAIDVSRVWPLKLAALREHVSQLAAADLERRTTALAERRGAQLGARFGEAFARLVQPPGSDRSIEARRASLSIALVTQLFTPEFEGGTELVVRAQARELAALGHRVRVVCGSNEPLSGDAIELARVDGLDVHRIRRRPAERYDLALERPRVAELVREAVGDADLVHVHHWSTLHGALVRDLCPDRPVVVTLHDAFATCPRFFRAPRGGVECPPRGDHAACVRCIAADALVTREALTARARSFEAELAAAAAVLVPSAWQAARIAPLLGRGTSSLRVIPHGLCRSLIAAPPRVRRPGEPLRALHFGHLSAEKGALDLITMLGPFAAGQLELTLAGSTPERGFQRLLSAMRLPPNVRVHASYDEHALARLARDADLALFPSRLPESYGLVVDEALALGLPAWVSDTGAPAERIAAWGCGRVLPAGDRLGWSAALHAIVAEPAQLDAERARIPSVLPTARDAARALELVYTSLAASKVA